MAFGYDRNREERVDVDLREGLGRRDASLYAHAGAGRRIPSVEDVHDVSALASLDGGGEQHAAAFDAAQLSRFEVVRDDDLLA